MKTKKGIMTVFAAASLALCAFYFSGCRYIRYEDPQHVSRSANPKAMTYKQALDIIEDRMRNVPAGHHPRVPDVRNQESMRRFSMGITSVRVRKHRRTGYCLVELMNYNKVLAKFYVLNMDEGKQFSAAVDRVR